MSFPTFVRTCTYFYAGLYPEYGLVSLASFPNLRSIRWEGEASVHYALRQLQMVDSICEITEVCFSVVLNREFLRESYNLIDEILVSDDFPRLQRVRVLNQEASKYFPNLQELGILKDYFE